MTSPERVKKLLVITSATGAGHDTHAKAAAEWCGRMYGGNVDVRIEHLLENSHVFYRAGVSLYNWIQCHAPWFHHLYYHVVEFLDLLNFGKVTLGRGYFIGLLKSYQPDAILSVHDCLNRGYFELAKETLGSQVRCATYCPEFLGGYGFSRNWINPRGDFFFSRTSDVAGWKPLRSLESGKVHVAGHWDPCAFYEEPLSERARKEYLRNHFESEEDRFTLLLSTGGAGAQNHRSILEGLRPLASHVRVIALCGREETARAELEEWAKHEIPFPVRALGFRQDMPVLLQSCSAVVARAGATTAGESLICGCPVIFNAVGGIMPQEVPTWRYFKKHGIGFLATSASKVACCVGEWIKNPQDLVRTKERILSLPEQRLTPERFLRLLLD